MQVYFPSYYVDENDETKPDYKKLIEIKNGEILTKKQASFHPVIHIDTDNSPHRDDDNNKMKPTILVLYDETARHLHMLASGDLNHGKSVNELIPYKGPNPPLNSGLHKYNFLLYTSPHSFTPPGEKVDDRIRANFDLEKFEKDNELTPITSLYFLTEHPQLLKKV
jgi:hypothetical protein